MKIATVCFSRTLGGLELAALRRGAELQARGHTLLAVVPGSEGLIRNARSLGLETSVVNARIKPVDPAAAFRLRRLITRTGIEVLLVARTQDLGTAVAGAGVRTAVVLYQQMQSGVDKRDWYHNRIYRRLDGAIAITNRVREQLLTRTCLSPERVSVVAHGIDAARFSPEAVPRDAARARFELPADAFTAGIIGGIHPHKGQLEFVQALGIAAASDRELGARLHGLIVGDAREDSGYLRELREAHDALPFRDRVRFHPFADDPRFAFRACDVFVLASHSETFGMVLMEALALGVPSIATDRGGVPEIITDGENGLLVPRRDPGAIARALVRLYRSPELRDRLARNGRAFVREAHDLERQAARFEEAVAVALERRKRSGSSMAGRTGVDSG